MNDHEFDTLMAHFRAACTSTAERQHVIAATPRSAPARRMLFPVLASALVAVTAGVTTLAMHRHGTARSPHAGAQTVAASPASSSTDDALLTAVDQDLSDRVPQALAPLAVSYTSNRSATEQNQKEQLQ